MTQSLKFSCQNLLLFTVTLIVSVILLEITLRVVLPSPIIWKHPQEQYLHDPEIGHWLQPGQNAFTHDKIVHTNSAGIRDEEYPEQAQNGVYRILAIGDSQTFGNGLELEDSWPKQLEIILNENSEDVRFEVINSGLPGSDTWQHEIILQRMISLYHPDTAILAFYVNDVVTRFNPIKKDLDNGRSGLETRLIYLLKRSALILALRTSFQSIQNSLSPSRGNAQQLALLKGNDGASIDKRWQQVESSASKMKLFCDQEHIKFMVAALPRRDQISGQLPWEGYHKKLQTIMSRHHIPLTSMLEPLQESYGINGKDLFIPWDGHNSKLANQVIARRLAGSLLAQTDVSTPKPLFFGGAVQGRK